MVCEPINQSRFLKVGPKYIHSIEEWPCHRKIDQDYHLSYFMHSASMLSQEMLSFLKDLSHCWLLLSWLQSTKCPGFWQGNCWKVKSWLFHLILVIESLTAKWGLYQIWVGCLVPEGEGDLMGKGPWTLRGTEELHKPLYLCSSGQQAHRGEAVYTTQHL